MRKQNLFKVVLFTLLVYAVLTWLIPTGTASGSYVVSNGLQRIGVYELLSNSVLSFNYFFNYVLFIFGVTAFYGVLSKSGAYTNLLNKASKKLKGKERLTLAIVTVFFALLTSICGFNLIAFALAPLFVSMLVKLKFDRMTGFLATFGATLMGTIGSIYNSGITGVFNSAFSVAGYGANMLPKLALLIVPMAVYLFFIDGYGKGTLVSKTRSVLDDANEDVFELADKKEKGTTGLLVTLIVLIVFLILAVTPWENVFAVSIFTKFNDWLLSIKIGGHTIFKYILGDLPALGTFGNEDVLAVLFIFSLIIKAVSKMSFEEYKEGLAEGLKKGIVPAAVVSIAHTILILSVYFPITITAFGWILKLVPNFNIFSILTTSVIAILSTLTYIDASFVMQVVAPLVSSTYSSGLLSLIFQSMYGLASFIAPTSVILILGLEYLNIPYKTWIKFALKTLLEILVVILIIIIVMFLI